MEIQKFSPAKAEIQTAVEEVKNLSIEVNGYDAVKAGKKKLADYRIQVTKFGKKQREEAIAYQKEVLRQEKELLEMLAPVETKLKSDLENYDAIQKREERRVLLPSRKQMLETIGLKMTDDEILDIDEKDFAAFYGEKRIEFDEAQEAQKRAEEEKKRHQDEIERARQEAATQAKIEAEERAEKEKKEAAERVEREKAEAEQRKKEELEAKEREKQEAIDKIKREQEEKERKEREEKERLEREAKEEEEREKEEAERKKKEELEAKEREKQEAIKKAEREKQEEIDRVKREAEEKERARKEAEEKEKREAEEKERLEKVAREKMEKTKKYQEWLEKNGVNNTNIGSFKIEKRGESTYVLFKIIDTLQL